MLLTRVITAVIALVVVVGMVFFGAATAWAFFVLVIALLACWEWSRLSALSRRAQSAYLFLCGVIGGALLLTYVRDPDGAFMAAATIAFVVATLFWVIAAPLWLARHARPGPWVCAIAGWIVVWPTWFAFVVLRDASPWLLLAIAAIVWIADVAAYFSGKAFGRHKLAPAVSPGKTWEGAAGAIAAVAVYGVALAIAAHARPIPIARVFEFALGMPAVVAMLVLAALSVVGDLFESWMKRGAGMKDSSRLLPGHGGVLDRIDALTSTLPVAAFALSLGLGAT